MNVELGSVWIDNDSDLLIIVKSLDGNYNGKVEVVFNYVDRTGDKLFEASSGMDLFLKTKTKLVKDGDRDYSKGYEDGYDSGKNQWQDEYGFTVPNNTISSLESAAYAKGLKDKETINHSIENECFKKGFEKGKEFNKDDQNLNYRAGFNDGWHDCEASFELGNEFTDGIQAQAYDEGYDQAIDDLIEAGAIKEDECLERDNQNLNYRLGLDDGYESGYKDAYEEMYCPNNERERELQERAYSDGYSQGICDAIDEEDDCSEYEFGDVEDGEEEYCFSKELEKILNGAFVVDTKSDGVERKHSHYFKDVRHLDYVDVYEINKLFPIDDDTDCILHARKKLLVCGGRGGSKDMITDITDARDTLNRYLQIEGIE